MSETVQVKARRVSPEDLGWQRTPEHDHGGGTAYLRPDGVQHMFGPGKAPALYVVDYPIEVPVATAHSDVPAIA